MKTADLQQRLIESTEIPDGLLFYRSADPAEQQAEWQRYVARKYAERAAEIVAEEKPASQSLTISVTVTAPLATTPADPESRYWTIERAAEECTVCERTFAEWMAVGKVRYYKPGHRVLIDPAELTEDLAKFRRQRVRRRRKIAG